MKLLVSVTISPEIVLDALGKAPDALSSAFSPNRMRSPRDLKYALVCVNENEAVIA